MASNVVRYQYRLYPDAGQRAALAATFGCARVVFNDHLAANDRGVRIGPRRKYRSAWSTQPELVTSAKRTNERAWLAEVPDTALRQSVADAHRAYQAFFDSVTGKRRGCRVGLPRFKRKSDNQQSFRLTRQDFSIRKVNTGKALLRLPKNLGEIRIALSRDLPSAASSVTITKSADNRYYASFVVEREAQTPPALDRVAAVDLGLTDLVAVVYSDGTREKVPAPKHYRRAQAKLAQAQRELARRKKGSKNREKSRAKVATLHRKVRDTRADHHHKLARRLVNENQVVVFETLGITGLARTRLAKSVHDAAWGTLIRLVGEKAAEAGRTMTQIGRFEPTSQTCSICRHRDGKKTLDIRVWDCGNCGARLDRDYNAAVNVWVAAGQDPHGLSETLINACGENIRLQLAGADLDETGTTPQQLAA